MVTTISPPQVHKREILIVEDDHETAEVLSVTLESAGFLPTVALDGSSALEQVQTRLPHLLLLDLRLPDIDGLDVLRRIRQQSVDVPLIVLSGYNSREDLILALNAGADDFVGKPFVGLELLARIQALLRRVEQLTPPAEARLKVRGLELDTTRRMAFLHGTRLHLTPIEYGLLAALMRQVDQPISRDQLLHTVWGQRFASDYSLLRVNISRLREKMEENPRHPIYIVTVPGVGYVLPSRRP